MAEIIEAATPILKLIATLVAIVAFTWTASEGVGLLAGWSQKTGTPSSLTRRKGLVALLLGPAACGLASWRGWLPAAPWAPETAGPWPDILMAVVFGALAVLGSLVGNNFLINPLKRWREGS